MGTDAVELNLNGSRHEVDVGDDVPLLYVLRDKLKLSGPKFGCGLAQCGACSVLVEGRAVRACVTPIVAVAGKPITTLEGLGSASNPHPVQKAFIDCQAMQCGYCTNGMIIAAVDLLRRNAQPTRDEITSALDNYLCRCGSHNRIIEAIAHASSFRS